MTKRESSLAYGAWTAVCIFWGTTYLAIRIGLESLPPFLFSGLRFFAAGALLMGLLKAFKRDERLPQAREWARLWVIGTMVLGVSNGIVVWAEQWIPSGVVALLVAVAPFWFVGLERLADGGERVSVKNLIGILIGFGGLILLVAPSLTGATLDHRYLVGVVALQVGCLSWVGGSVWGKHHPSGVSPLMGAAAQMLAAGVMATLFGTLLNEWPRLHFTPRSAGAFVYLIFFGSIVGYGSYTYALQKLPTSFVSLYAYINPVIAVLLGWAVLRERLGWREIAAAAVILGGVAIVKSPDFRRRKSAEFRARLEASAGECSAAAK
jgi:drug/metabolite transporter (DMT)-like permease